MLEFLCLRSAKECEVINQSPRAIMVGVNGIAEIVFGKAAFHVAAQADIDSIGIYLAAK